MLGIDTFVLRFLAVCLLLASGVLVAPLVAQEADEDSPYRPGLVSTYAAAGQTAVRTDEVVAFDWQDAVCDPRLPAGEFSATWRGRLWTKGTGSYRLQCFAQGEVAVKLAGKTVISGQAQEPQWLVSQPLELEFDYHPLEITYRRAGTRGQLALFWTGPDFRLEPVPERALWHEREQTPPASFERGRQLAAALWCGACHQDTSAAVMPAPALDRLTGNIQEAWLVDWLSSHTGGETSRPPRRMPDLALTREEATAVAAWLLREPAAKARENSEQTKAKETKESDKGKRADAKGSKKAKDEKPKPSAGEGERLVLTRGCLACHQLESLGESGMFGGGDLTTLAAKRPSDFLTRWLENPAAINRQHRMPMFSFTSDELTSLSLWAKDQAKAAGPAASKSRSSSELIKQGEQLITSLRCGACHALSRGSNEPLAASQKELTAGSNWTLSCAGEPQRERGRPGFRLTADDRAALAAYYSQPRPGEGKLSMQTRGRDLLIQLNCLACHQREGIDRTALTPLPSGEGVRGSASTLQDKLAGVADAHPDLAPLVPAMTPPALNSVGDKLHDAALADSITQQGPPHRPYLLVQMPKFDLTKDQLASLVAYFSATDRIPDSTPHAPREGSISRSEMPTMAALAAAGPRLVTTDGLACTSCHQVGSVLPSKAPLNARGPDMTMLGKRIRREWFDRWCDNPARIVPRMEMPAVKIPVRGVLNDKIDDQLAAVWHILNTPGFEPPEPNPVRVLRLSGIPERNERPIVIHDVVKDGDKTYLFPLVIGLPNRHNILFDLETNRLAAWWLGDTARQRTKGKSWYWELGGKSILEPGFKESEISIWMDGKERLPVARGQFTYDVGLIGKVGASEVHISGELWFSAESSKANDRASQAWTYVGQHFRSHDDRREPVMGFERVLIFGGNGQMEQARLQLMSSDVARECQWDEESRTLTLSKEQGLFIRVLRPLGITWDKKGSLIFRANTESPRSNKFGIRNGSEFPDWPQRWQATVVMDYVTALPADQFVAASTPTIVPATELAIAPGLIGHRLPLLDDVMPSALTWNSKGELIVATLKGEVLKASDADRDQQEDTVQTIADGLATPYGIYAGDDYIDVATKDGLLRLKMDEHGRAWWVQTIASGWGYTDDYHDWAVGLIRGDRGEYYVALPCQQDQRTGAAAALRGTLLKLTPHERAPQEYHEFDIEVISSGHRFPMGMARNREGELFVTDNQGNYNPFNELNHVRQGAHFGFINANEKAQGYKPPPLTAPAIDIPHPWTRSVNGICFLDTPRELREKGKENIYGPLEGHLVGCEYDTRRLIRMSLQKVNGEYQGAAYALSIPTEDVEKGLLGPIVCAIKPTTGELYVGEIRDSGWGAGNNIGQIVKIKIEPDKLPCGIAEVRATHTGFMIDFCQPVDRAKAANLASYSIESYRRESTPAYGGPDIDRRTEKVSATEVSPDGKRVTLTLSELRAGHNYELRLKNLTPGGGMFHPDEAHYTLRQIP